VQQQPERLRLQWTYAPLVAYAIFLLWPNAAVVVNMLLAGRPRIQDIVLWILLVTFYFAAANWAFLYLYIETRRQVEEVISRPIGSVRIAMWSSLIAMAIPSAATILWLEGYIRLSSRLLPFGIFYVLLCFPFVFPIFGLIGWFAGRAIHRITAWTWNH
jgi:hypothetical protein